MTRPFRRLWPIALLVGLAGTGLAAERKLPGLTFQTPASGGWTEKQYPDGIVLQKSFTYERRKGGALLLVGAKPMSGDFNAEYQKVANGLDQLKSEEPMAERTGVSTFGHPMRSEIRCCGDDGPSVASTLVAFNPPGFFVYVQLVEINLEDEDEDAMEAEFEAVIDTLDFAGLGRRPPLPPYSADGATLAGLYSNSEGTLMPNPFGGLDYVVNTTTYFFDGSGLYADVPPYGAADLPSFCAKSPSECGTYTVNGSQITMNAVSDKYAMVTTDTDELELEDGGLNIGGRNFYKVEPLSDLKLDGTWTYFWASSGSTATSSGGVSSTRTLKLTSDGRFARSGYTSATSTNETGGSTTGVTVGGGKPEQTGTYKIDGYTLTLTFDGGGEELSSLYMPDKNDIDLLMIDGNAYLREGRDKN